MKTNKFRCRPASLAKTRWAAYAAAGAATALGGSHTAEADIHYSGPVHVQFPPHMDRLKTFPLDQPGDSLVFEHSASVCYLALFSMNGIVSAAFRGYGGRLVSKLSFGQNISTGEFVTRSYGIMAVDHVCLAYGAPWDDAGTGYVGFRFNNGAGIQYGWARVTTTGALEQNGFRVVAYAYADPGEPIRAGQTSSNENVLPDESSLGWLALGAAGLVAWRKRRSRMASPE